MFRWIAIVFRHEFMTQFKRRVYLLTTFGLPLLGLVIYFGYQFIESQSDASAEDQVFDFDDYETIGYVDPTGIFTAPTMPPFSEKIKQYPDESTAQKALESGDIKIYYLIHGDYLETGNVDLVAQTFSLEFTEETDLFKAFVLSFWLDNETTTNLYLRLQNPMNIVTHRIEESGETTTSNEDTDFLLSYIFSIAMLVATMTSSGYLMQSVIEERETRMIEIIISSIRPMPLLAGKILAMGFLGLIQVFIWLGTVVVILSQASDNFESLSQIEVTPGAIIISILYFVLGYLLLGAGFAAIGSISNNMREGPQLATFITLPAVAPLWVITLIVTEPQGTVAVVLSLIPLTAPLTMVMRASIISVPLVELVLSLVLLGGAIWGTMWIAGRLFRTGSLLAGTTPSWRDIPRLLFG